MKVIVFSVIAAALLLFLGCEQSHDAPPPPSDNHRPGVEVHTPNVDVKTNEEGTTVKAPDTNVRVEKKEP